jgi:dTDP-4-dehydrorhamnose reductase
MRAIIPARVGDVSGNRNHLLCFGFGYVARALAAALPRTWTITGTIHDTPIAVDDVTLVPFAEADPAIAQATHILISIPPNAENDPTLARHGAALADADHLTWIAYLSTTGVYGDTGGRPVDETAALVPTLERGRRRVQAEFAWQDLATANDLPLHVFRLSGIYGPGRSPLDQARAGTARRVMKPGHVFSRIHVDDIVQALMLSMNAPRPGAIYNLADDEAAEPAEVTRYAYELLGRDPPAPVPFDDAVKAMSAMARSFWDDQRRIDNTKIKRELGLRLKYPTYREGLAAILSSSAPTTAVSRSKS